MRKRRRAARLETVKADDPPKIVLHRAIAANFACARWEGQWRVFGSSGVGVIVVSCFGIVSLGDEGQGDQDKRCCGGRCPYCEDERMRGCNGEGGHCEECNGYECSCDGVHCVGVN